jgi:hypothetical protein
MKRCEVDQAVYYFHEGSEQMTIPTHFIGILTEAEKHRWAAGPTQGKLEGFERLRTGIAAEVSVPID